MLNVLLWPKVRIRLIKVALNDAIEFFLTYAISSVFLLSFVRTSLHADVLNSNYLHYIFMIIQHIY